MSKATATEPVLALANSHYVNLGRGSRPDKEEVHPRCDVTWRGDRFRVTVACDRYTGSNGGALELEPWRCYVTGEGYHPGESPHYGENVPMTDTARRAINEAVGPIVRAWLANEATTLSGRLYADSYREALGHAVRRTAEAPPDYTVRRFTEALAANADALEGSDRERLERAAELLAEVAELLS